MNVCKFTKNNCFTGELNIINFVYETERFGNAVPYILHCFRICLVTEGSGILISSGKTEELSRGDIFFTFPKTSFTLEGDDSFKYMYISYVGDRAESINREINIAPGSAVHRGHIELIPLWENGMNTDESMIRYAGEGILLYTLSRAGAFKEEHPPIDTNSSAKNLTNVKKYLDNNFGNPELSLDTVSKMFFYNRKYMSSSFKHKYGTGINEYITALRINRALYLIEHNYTTVKTISSLCGFKDPMYFSKVFSKNIGMAPREYIKRTLSNNR